MKDRESISHPSYGMIEISRISADGKKKFFGSELSVDHWIELTIYAGEVDRDLTKDWFHQKGRQPHIKIALTPVQFAELLTNFNQGDGLPCTILQLNGEHIAADESFESKKDATARQFTERMQMFTSTIKETRDKAKLILKKKTLSKDDQFQLSHHLDWLTNEIDCNIPFFMQCFQETADKIIIEAKTEIEAAIIHRIQSLGLEVLHQQNNLLKQPEQK